MEKQEIEQRLEAVAAAFRGTLARQLLRCPRSFPRAIQRTRAEKQLRAEAVEAENERKVKRLHALQTSEDVSRLAALRSAVAEVRRVAAETHSTLRLWS